MEAVSHSNLSHGALRHGAGDALMQTPSGSAKQSSVDFILQDCGSILFLHPQNKNATDWINDNVSSEGWQPHWPSVLLEPRYASDLIKGLQNDGFVVEVA